MTAWDIGQIVLVIVAVIALVIVLRARQRSYYRFLDDFSDQEVCDHLKGALELLKSRGHRVFRAGQTGPEMPLEIHVAPNFDPKAIAEELKLEEPVFVSERQAMCCREDGCEIRSIEP